MSRQDMAIHEFSSSVQENPWYEWLLVQIRMSGLSRVEAAHENDLDALRSGKIRMEVAEEVRMLVERSARIYQDARAGSPRT